MTWIEQSTRKNLLITKSLFTQQIVLELELLNYFDAWSLEPTRTPFFKASDDGTAWESLDDDFSYTLPFQNLAVFFFPFRPLKRDQRVHVSTFPPKKDVEKLPFKKIVAFAVNSVGVGVPSPSNHRDRDDWVLWRVGPVSHDLPPERRLQPQRGESFMEGERTIVKGSAASWGIKIQTLIFRRGWSMMLDSIFHKQRGRLGENVFFHANQPFPIGPWLPRILEVQVETLRQIHKEHSEGDALVTRSFRGSHSEMWFLGFLGSW